MIKAVVFDLGGVYFTNGTVIATNKLENLLDVDKDTIFKVLSKEEGFLYRLGKITEEEFWDRAVKRLKITPDYVPKIKEIWHSSYKPNEGMKELVREVRRRYKVVAFSGNIPERVAYLNEKYGLDEEFDDYIFSFDIGLGKLDTDAYKTVIKRVGLKPEEFVFIDDHPEFLEIAEKFGIKTILFKDAEQLKKDLIKMGFKID